MPEFAERPVQDRRLIAKAGDIWGDEWVRAQGDTFPPVPYPEGLAPSLRTRLRRSQGADAVERLDALMGIGKRPLLTADQRIILVFDAALRESCEYSMLHDGTAGGYGP